MKFAAVYLLGFFVVAVDATRGENLRLSRHLKSDKGGSGSGSGGSSGGSSGGTNANCLALDGSAPDDCVICDPCNKVKPPSLTLAYYPDGVNSAYQDETKASCREGTYPSNPGYIEVLGKDGTFRETWDPVVVGQPFTIDATTVAFDAETRFRIEGWTGGDSSTPSECFVHTSCSQPLVIGDQIGPFRILEGNECATQPPSVAPAVPPVTPPPSESTIPPCIDFTTSIEVCVGDALSINFDYAGTSETAMIDDWIGIYPSNATIFFHAKVWQWACGDNPANPAVCPSIVESGSVTFDSLPFYNAYGPHKWPVAAGSYKAVLLRADGPSVPPYIPICESTAITIINC